MADLRDLYETPHDRGELNHLEVLQLVDDWNEAGRPEEWEDMLEFLANHPRWRDLPVYVITNTLDAMEKPHG